MKKNRQLLLLSVVSGLLLTSCADLSTSPQWDASFGLSVARLKQMQTLNPAGTRPLDPDSGIDAAAAVSAQDNYVKSFAAPAKSGGSSLVGGR